MYVKGKDSSTKLLRTAVTGCQEIGIFSLEGGSAHVQDCTVEDVRLYHGLYAKGKGSTVEVLDTTIKVLRRSPPSPPPPPPPGGLARDWECQLGSGRGP